MGIGRLWGNPGGFLDLAAVIIEIRSIEAGCGDFGVTNLLARCSPIVINERSASG
jgi:hypothetical protein